MTSSLPLILKSLNIRDLRCHRSQQWSLGSHINIVQGENGIGKTTLLEAAYMMAHGRSFRQARDPELVNWQADRFFIEGAWYRYGPIQVGIRGKRGRTEVSLQGKSIAKRKELLETLPVVVDAPQSRRLVDGATGERRRWLDQLTSVCEPTFQHQLSSYSRAMMQRARLLRRCADVAQLESWEHQMVVYGQRVRELRQRILQQLNHQLEKEADHQWMDAALTLVLKLSGDDSSKSENAESAWLNQLKDNRDSDRKTGRCSIGPHADTLQMMYHRREIRTIGSRGQQKLASIALKLAECATRSKYRRLWPLLLLDDCMEALDQKRRHGLLRRLQQYPGQMCLTAPNDIHLPSDMQANVMVLPADDSSPDVDMVQQCEAQETMESAV